MNKQVTTNAWTAEEVWAAAVLATRLNGGYYKTNEYNQDGQLVRMDNRSLMLKALEDSSQIPEADFEQGTRARAYIKNRCLMKMLRGQNETFDHAVARAAELDHITSDDKYNLALICSQITSYFSGVREEEYRSRADRSKGHLGKVGDKVSTTVDVYKSVYSQKYATFYVSALTDTNQLVFFSYRNRLVSGEKYKITGSVKGFRDDVTQLNRVRVVDN